MNRRSAAFALLLALGLALTVWGARLADDPRLVSVDGPFHMRYDEANDTTLLVVACWYCEPPFALVIAGDARAHRSAGTLHLWNTGEPYVRAPVAPMAVDGREVHEALVGPFELASVGWRIAVLVAGLASLAGAGALLLERVAGADLRASLAWGAAGIGAGWAAGTTGDGGIFLVFLAVLVACVVGLALLVPRRTRRYAPGFALVPTLAIPALLWLSAYSPAPPAI